MILVTVQLNAAAFALPNSPVFSGPTFDFELPDDGTPDADLCEVVFGICNSYPGELHCPAEYAEIVDRYREQRLRSLSVGDTVTITRGTEAITYTVATLGFTQEV